MKSVHRKMSWEEFEDHPWQLGWKHEYYGGRLHATPSKTAIINLALPLSPRPESDQARIEPVQPGDRPALIALYRLAFRDAPEFADLDRRSFFDLATKNVDRFLSQSDQPWIKAASVLRQGKRLLAAAFIVPDGIHPLLQPLFVRPAYHRQGCATVLMNHVVNRLIFLGATTLLSQCHLANRVSEAWHRRFGFEEIPDEWVAAHRARFYQHELERRDRLGQWVDGEREGWAQQTIFWNKEWKRLWAKSHETVSFQVRGWP